MPTQKIPSEILLIGKASQYIAANKVSEGIMFKGGVLDQDIAIKIYMERTGIQNRYDLNPSNPTLIATANYLYRILYNPYQAEQAIENAAGARPVVAGPANQTINISGTASFTITVSSDSLYVIAWYRNGVLVPGQTGLNYSYAATISNNGDIVNAIVTNATGSTNSAVATLTVTATLMAYLSVSGSSQRDTILAGVDNLDYQFNTTMSPASATFDFTLTPEAANNMWQVVKWPTSWGVVTEFFSTNLNNGIIPGPEYFGFTTIGSNSYICSRVDVSFDPSFPLVFKRP